MQIIMNVYVSHIFDKAVQGNAVRSEILREEEFCFCKKYQHLSSTDRNRPKSILAAFDRS